MMKIISHVLIGVVLLTLSGCNKYLNILPDDKPVLEDAFKDRFNSEKYLFTCYASLPNFVDPNNALGITGGGDILYYEKNLTGPPSTMMPFMYGNNVANPYVNFWEGKNGASRNIWEGIRNCNVFLEHIRVEDGGPRDMEEAERDRWIAEVKTIKAYLNFYLLQLYGPIPIVDKVIPIAAKGDELDFYREPVDKVTDYIVDLLDDATLNLPFMSELDPTTEYGRFTKTIALSIKAKVLVLAASPIFNNNNYYAGFKDKRGIDLFPVGDSQQRWERALQACDEAVRAAEADGAAIFVSTDGGNGAIGGVSSININDTTKAMVSLRQAVTESWNPEVIWATNENGDLLQKWATMMSNDEWQNNAGAAHSDIGSRHSPTLNVVELFYSSHGVPIEEDTDWQNNGWYQNRYNTQLPDAEHSKYFIKQGQETAILHFHRSLRFYASVGFDGGIWEGRNKLLTAASFPNMMRYSGSGQKTDEKGLPYPYTGYLTKKLSHLKTTYSETRITLTTQKYSFPIIRLADLYLLLAESLNEVGGPVKTDSKGNNAYFYLDQIRARSGMEGIVASWNKYALPAYKSKPDNINGLRDIIRRERINELAFEGHFYYDVRRWLMGEEMFNQPILGWNKDGENKRDFYNVRVLLQPRFSMKDYLMPLSTNSLLQNRNFVQNPGW